MRALAYGEASGPRSIVWSVLNSSQVKHMATIYHQVRIDGPTGKLYEAISTAKGIGSWWDSPDEVEIRIGSVLQFNLGEPHGVLQMKVLALRSGERVEWECVSNHPASSPASAWSGTHVTFNIAESAPMAFESPKRSTISVLDFRQSGWDENNRYFGYCNFGWGEALLKLKALSEAV